MHDNFEPKIVAVKLNFRINLTKLQLATVSHVGVGTPSFPVVWWELDFIVSLCLLDLSIAKI